MISPGDDSKLEIWEMPRYCSPQIRSDFIYLYFTTEEDKVKLLTF